MLLCFGFNQSLKTEHLEVKYGDAINGVRPLIHPICMFFDLKVMHKGLVKLYIVITITVHDNCNYN